MAAQFRQAQGLLVWAVLVALASWWAARAVQVDSDLRLFLPEPATPAERILLEELKEGPGTRMLLVALEGADATTLATVSDQVTAMLRADPLFSRVENGSLDPDPRLLERVMQYRYLLSPRPGGCACDAAQLQRELEARLTELGSPAGALSQELLLRDPSGEVQAILDRWLPASEPQLKDGVWFSSQDEALLLLQTQAPGFDADRQREAIAALRAAVTSASDQPVQMQVAGPGAFTVVLEEAVRGDVALLGTLAGAGSILFLYFVLRSLRHTVLGFLTLATTGVVALLGVAALSPSVHGITLAFGFTLLGVAMDYPVHLMLHLDRDIPARTTAGHVWPTLRLSILTTCIAYLALVLAGFTGLTQLGLFTVCGLIGTALIVRMLVPGMMDPAAARSPPAWIGRFDTLPRLPWLPVAILAVAVLALSLSSRPLWSNDLSGLTPVPQALQDLDLRLRRELGAPDLRYVLAVRAGSAEAALQRDEALQASLQQLVKDEVIGGIESPSRILPSSQRQREIQAQLPEPSALQTALDQAVATTPFREEAFSGFAADVEASRALAPLTPADLRGTPLADRLAAVLIEDTDETLALVTLSDVRDASRLEAWVQTAGADVLLLDLTGTAEALVARYRNQALFALGLALAVIAVLMLWHLRIRTAVAVVLPVLATLAAAVAVLHWAGAALTLFHVVALLLVGGLSFDYGLFFNRREPGARETLQTRYAVTVCWLSTAGAFALLMLSAMPVLEAIGTTVTLGVTLGFVLALLGRKPQGENASHAA